MKFAFLADENLSPETADYLESLGHTCHSLTRDGPRQISDRQVAALAESESRIILTHDLDFGEIYYSAADGRIGVLVLRLRNQTVESVNRILTRFLQSPALDKIEIDHSLVILSETTYRVYHGPRGSF